MPEIHEDMHADSRGVPYYVYWNKPNGHARVHHADCGDADYGRGKHGGSAVDDGWLGPFDAIRQAWDAAHAKAAERNLPLVAACKKCLGIFDTETRR